MKKLLSAALAAATVSGVLVAGNTATLAEEIPFVQKDNVISVYDEEGGFYKGMAVGTTAEAFLAEFEAGHTLKNAKGEAISGDTAIGSDYTINFGDKSRKIVIYGDVNRDAKQNLADASAVLKMSASYTVDTVDAAADVTLDGKVNLLDVSLLMKSVAKWDVECGFVSWKYELVKTDAPAEDDTLEMYFTHSTVREGPTVSKPNDVYSYDMYMAKNEYEGCHVNLYSENGHEGLSATFTQFKDKNGNELETELMYEVSFASTTTDLTTPDMLPPISVVPEFDIDKGTAQGLYLKVKTDFDTTPGMYRAKVDIKDASGQTVKRAYVYTYVWNFEVPEEPSVQTAFGMGTPHADTLKDGTNENMETYIKYYEYFLENRITPWCMPFMPTDERADEYMSDPRVTTFLVYGGYAGDPYGNSMNIDETSPEYLTSAYEKITASEDWTAKALFYMDDEPRFADGFKSVENHYNYINQYYPDARIVVPIHVNYAETGDWSDVNTGFDNENNYPEYDGLDTYAVLDKYTTVLCPSTRLFPTYDVQKDGVTNWYTEYITDTYGTILDRLEKSRNEGNEIWWYTANTPTSPMNNISLNNTGMEARTLFWQQYDYDIDGMLYWATTEWGEYNLRPGANKPVSGEAGVLVYPGVYYRSSEPIACLRAEIVRDGLEDLEYLVLAEELLGKEVADEYNHKIVTDITTFETDEDVLEAVRRELGNAIEAAVNEG